MADGDTFGPSRAEELRDEHRNVLLALAQGRQHHLQHREAMVEIFAEALLRHLLAQLAVRRGDDAHVDLAIAAGAERLDLLAIDRAQKARLQVERQLADLVDEQRAPVRLHEGAVARRVRAGEGAARVTEQLALDERRRHCRAVEHDERPLGARAARVDGLGADLLAGAGLAVDQDGAVRRGRARQQREDLTHRQRAPDQAPEAIAVGRRQRLTALAGEELQLRVTDADHGAGADEDLAKARALVKRAVARVEIGDAHAVAEHLELEMAPRNLRIAQRERASRRRADVVGLALG